MVVFCWAGMRKWVYKLHLVAEDADLTCFFIVDRGGRDRMYCTNHDRQKAGIINVDLQL